MERERHASSTFLGRGGRLAAAKSPRRHWRDYRTRAGRRPVKDCLDGLSDEEVAAIIAGMKDVAERGLPAARHLRGEIYEVRADATTRSFRVLFATEGRYSQVLLSLSAFEKRTQKTPPREIELAELPVQPHQLGVDRLIRTAARGLDEREHLVELARIGRRTTR